MLCPVLDFPEHVVILGTLLIRIFLGVQDFKHSCPCLIDSIQNRLFFALKDLHVYFHEPAPQFGKLRDIWIRLILFGDLPHLRNDLFQLLIYDVSLAIIIDCKHIQCSGEDLLLFTVEECLYRFIILGKVIEVFSVL